MNSITYIVYFLMASITIIYVGNACYKNGKVYILNYFPNDVRFGNGINNLLRIAYYFLNIGLVIWTLHSLRNIDSMEGAIVEISMRLGYILLIIAQLHIINMTIIYLIHKSRNNENRFSKRLE